MSSQSSAKYNINSGHKVEFSVNAFVPQKRGPLSWMLPKEETQTPSLSESHGKKMIDPEDF